MVTRAVCGTGCGTWCVMVRSRLRNGIREEMKALTFYVMCKAFHESAT